MGALAPPKGQRQYWPMLIWKFVFSVRVRARSKRKLLVKNRSIFWPYYSTHTHMFCESSAAWCWFVGFVKKKSSVELNTRAYVYVCVCLLWPLSSSTFIQSILHLIWFNLISFNLIHSQWSIYLYINLDFTDEMWLFFRAAATVFFSISQPAITPLVLSVHSALFRNWQC